MMKAKTISYQKTEIEFPPIKTKKGRDNLKKRCLEAYSKDERLIRVIKCEQHWLFNELDEHHVLRIATPGELGYENGIYTFGVEDVADKNGLTTCPTSITIRLALEFEKMRSSIPSQYLERSWYVHMSPIDFKMSGDMFVVGMGCPDPVFVILPFPSTMPLAVEWVYGGRRANMEVDKNQPILFACR